MDTVSVQSRGRPGNLLDQGPWIRRINWESRSAGPLLPSPAGGAVVVPRPDALPGRGRRLLTCGLLSARSVCPVHQPFQFLRGLSWEPDDRRDRALRRTRPGELAVTPAGPAPCRAAWSVSGEGRARWPGGEVQRRKQLRPPLWGVDGKVMPFALIAVRPRSHKAACQARTDAVAAGGHRGVECVLPGRGAACDSVQPCPISCPLLSELHRAGRIAAGSRALEPHHGDHGHIAALATRLVAHLPEGRKRDRNAAALAAASRYTGKPRAASVHTAWWKEGNREPSRGGRVSRKEGGGRGDEKRPPSAPASTSVFLFANRRQSAPLLPTRGRWPPLPSTPRAPDWTAPPRK